MIRFKYSLSSFSNFLSELASALKTSVQDNTIQLPSFLGNGYFKSVDLPNGLQALLIDCTLTEDLLIERERTNLEFYVFVCDSATNVNRYYMHIDEEQTTGKHSSASVMYLLSFLSNLQQFATAGTVLKSIRIIMSREWLAKYLKIDQMDEVLQRYLALKTRSIHIREIDLDSRILMSEIFNPPQEAVPEPSYLQTRILKLLENFFGWMYLQMANVQFTLGIPRDEIHKMVEVEAELLNNLSLAPTIDQLAKKAAMSPSKLKKQFRDVYGRPIYEYFQKHRMERARDMLVGGKRSIKEVGIELGYSNMSNFSLAFKKEFQILPSQLVKLVVNGGIHNN